MNQLYCPICRSPCNYPRGLHPNNISGCPKDREHYQISQTKHGLDEEVNIIDHENNQYITVKQFSFSSAKVIHQRTSITVLDFDPIWLKKKWTGNHYNVEFQERLFDFQRVSAEELISKINMIKVFG